MCGRYSFAPTKKQADADELRRRDQPTAWKISFNIAPTHQAPVITNDQPNLLQAMTWGLVPHWSRDGANGGQLINARAEGIADKPSFREPIRSRRCLVPADSFYEWRTEPGGRKLPYRILLSNNDLLMMAGIWDEWRQGDEVKRTFSIITTAPNREMAELHNRMPLFFEKNEAQARWLAPLSEAEVAEMRHPPADGLLRMYRVSEKLNAPSSAPSAVKTLVGEKASAGKPNYDAADLHEEVADAWRLF